MYRFLILYTLLDRYPNLRLELDSSETRSEKVKVIPVCQINKLVCRDPNLSIDELDMLPTSGQPEGTYHLSHFHSYRSESCGACPVYIGSKESK